MLIRCCRRCIGCQWNKASCISWPYWPTLCLKKVPTFELSVTLSNLNRVSKFLHCWKAYEIYYKTHTHLTLGMLLHYLAKLKIQIFCRYSADVAEMQTYCILIASNLVVHPQTLTLSMFKIASLSWYWFQIKVLSKSCSRRFIPCWLLRDTAVTSTVTNFRCHKLIAKINK